MDAETNTECVFIQQPVIGRKSSHGDIVSRLGAASSVKRSKTFGPSAPIAKSQYNCRVSYLSLHIHGHIIQDPTSQYIILKESESDYKSEVFIGSGCSYSALVGCCVNQ